MTRLFVFAIALMATLGCSAQNDTIIYRLNGRSPSLPLPGGKLHEGQNPFAGFVGEWTLKDDLWTQNWGGATETITIEGHHTVCKTLNTNHSLLSVIDGPEPNGHIFWNYNPETRVVHHSSSFGTSRIGQGTGTISETGDLSLRLTFADEPEGTYRRYTYKWLNEDEYEMTSVQMGPDDQPTGLHYGGRFVRIPPTTGDTYSAEQREILEHGRQIRAAFAASDLAAIRILHHPEVTKALGYGNVQHGREAVLAGLRGMLEAYRLLFEENEVESILIQGDVAIEQTRFSIRGTPLGDGAPFVFKGRTMVTYVRHAASPSGWATIREIIQPAED